MEELYVEKLSIKEWDADDRPREKLLQKGRSSLSDAELIAILIGSGNRKETAVELSKRILNSVANNQHELAKLSVSDLQKFQGIGEAKAISIIAALELGRRRQASEVMQKEKVSGSRDIYQYIQGVISDLPYEEFWIILLNRANKIIAKKKVSEGGVAGTLVDTTKLFKYAIQENASSIILSHNHPSGNLTPSSSDIELTKKLKESGKLLNLPILDHIIVGEQAYYSFADEGIL